MKTYQKIAQTLTAIQNCVNSNNAEWEAKHRETLADIMANAPSGSGIDCGTKLTSHSFNSKGELQCFVLSASYHHMNGDGMYDGWTDHDFVITAGWDGPEIRITGRDRNDTKDYLYDVYYTFLTRPIAT